MSGKQHDDHPAWPKKTAASFCMNGIYAEDATTGGLLTQIGVGITTKPVATSFLTVITQSSASAAIAIGGVDTLTAGQLYFHSDGRY